MLVKIGKYIGFCIQRSSYLVFNMAQKGLRRYSTVFSPFSGNAIAVQYIIAMSHHHLQVLSAVIDLASLVPHHNSLIIACSQSAEYGVAGN